MELSSLIYLLPPFIAILLVIITRKPILSLTVSIGSGLLILYGFSFSLLKNTYTILKEVGTDSWNIKLILVLIVLGGFIGVVEYALQNKNIKLTKFFQSKKKVLFIGWLSGLLLFIDDYLNILLNGVFLNAITKKHRISKAKIAFIIHSLSISACVLIPFSTWTVYIVSIIKNLNLENSYGIFIKSIPYNFYAISLVFITLAVILYEINLLGMKKEEEIQKTVKNEKKYKDEITLKEVLFPAFLLVIVSLIILFGSIVIKSKNVGLSYEVIASLNVVDILLYTGIISTIILFVYYLKKKIKIQQLSNSFLFGSKQMFQSIVMLFLAWILGNLTLKLNTAAIIIDLSKGFMLSSLLVLGIFIITSMLAFMTSSWATFAIVIPIFLPLGIANNINPSLIIAAIVSGGIFGDHNSPVSSTTILTKVASKIEITKHFKTQLPYSLIAFIISSYLFLLMGGKA